MDSRGLGYDYGGGSGVGGKIRRRAPSRAAAASPYARPASAPAPAAPASRGGGWFSRIIAAGASRILPSLFRKTPPQLIGPPRPAPPPVALDAAPVRPETSHDLRPLQLESLDAPPSPPPPPLEDDLPEGEENDGAIANDSCTEICEKSAMEGEKDTLRHSDDHCDTDLEELLRQKTFTRSQFEYLADLLWSRTVGSNSCKLEDGSIKKMHVSEKENGFRCFNLPVNSSIRMYSVADQVASPAEIAKAYMGLKSTSSPLRLRLHDPSSVPIRSMETNTMKKAKPATIPLFQGSRLHASKLSDRPENNFATPNRSAIYKMSSSPYFRDLYGTASSSHQTPSSVHTFGRQILKRKSATLHETLSVGPIRRMQKRHNRTSPLLETRPGHNGYLGGYASKRDEEPEQTVQAGKLRCLDTIGDTTLDSLDNNSHAVSFGQAPVQSAEMAAKILKQLYTPVPSSKESTSEIKQRHGNNMDVEDLVSLKKEAALTNKSISQKVLLKVDSVDSLQMDNGNGSMEALHQSNEEFEKKQSLVPEHTGTSLRATNKEKPPAFSLRSNAHSSLTLSSETERNKMPVTSNGFTFPVQAVLGAQSQPPPTPTMASPPRLPVQKQCSAVSGSLVTSVETVPRVSKSVTEEGTVAPKCGKFKADDQPMSSIPSGEVASFTSKPVFKFVNSKSTSLSNGLEHTSNSTVSVVLSSNRSTDSASKSSHSSSTGGSSIFSSTFSKPVTSSSLAPSSAGHASAPFSFFPQLQTASSSVVPDKSKEESSSTPFSTPQQLGTAGSSAAQDKSKAASPMPTYEPEFQQAQPGNSCSLFTQKISESNLNFKSSEKANYGRSQTFSNSPVGSAPFLGYTTKFSASSLFSLPADSGSTSVPATTPSSPAISSGFGLSAAFSSSQIFDSNLTTTTPPSFGLPNTGPATSPFNSTSSAVFSFTSATPSVPDSSPTTPIFGGASPPVGSSTGTDQMYGGISSFSTPSVFGFTGTSPTQVFCSASTQFASTTSASPDIFKFGQQSQDSSGAFSMGPGSRSEKSGRRMIKVKRKK